MSLKALSLQEEALYPYAPNAESFFLKTVATAFDP